ncbi:MAG: manganese efflux pump [Erysipelotrichaceae bacterium]|nr:manganese efflux pump [Erysipelotrichaceae bacterium]
MLEAFLLGIALAMDAFAVSIVNGIRYQNYHKKEMILSSFFFGLFQGAMPLLGAFIFLRFMNIVESIDHWVVFTALSILGWNMMREGLHPETVEEKGESFTFKILIAESIATSIDALSAGVSLPFMGISVYLCALIIALTTMVICLFGHFMGKKLGMLLKDKAVFVGGLILFLIGLKTLLEHLEVL